MSLRNFIRHTRLLIEQGLYETRKIGNIGQQRALELTRLEERVLFSASAIAPVVAEIAEVGGDLFSAAASADHTADSSSFSIPDQQLLDLVADSTLPDQAATQNGNAATDQQTLELVFLDSSIGNLDQMISNLKSQNESDSSRTLEFVVLDSTKDGIAQITASLLRYNGVDGLHIVSNGEAGQVQLGSTLLSMDNLDRYRTAISAWQYSMSDKADVLFYGCNLAAFTEGQQLLSEIGKLTDTHVAASEDLEITVSLVPDANQASTRHELVILDPGVQNSAELRNLLLAQQDAGRNMEFVVLDADRDGVQQISEILARYQGLDAVHVLSHGTADGLQLGSTWLDAQSINSYADSIRVWQSAFGENGDLLLYGCDLAATDAGRSLVDTVAQWTGTDVAASTDLTGYALFGGDWDLEYRTGSIETEDAADLATQRDWFGLMSVAVDATSTGSAQGTNSVTVSHTTTSAGERLMLVGVSIDATGGTTVTGVTYGGQALTLVGTQTSGGNPVRVDIWRLINPASGTANVVVNLNRNADGVSVGVTTFTGVNQSTPLGTFASAIGTSATPSVNVTSATGELVYDVVAAKDGTLLTQGANQTELWELADSGGNERGASSTEAGAASVTMSWSKTTSGTAEWAIGAVSIKPSSETTLSQRVLAASDDAEEEGPTGTTPNAMNLTSSDIELVKDVDAPTAGVQKVGLRFTAMNIPVGATITNAYLVFRAVAADPGMTNSEATSLTLRGQLIGDAPTFTTTSGNISSRTLTTASAAWTPTAWTTGSNYNSADISSVVQEIVDQGTWASGNDLAIIITGTGHRASQAYDTAPSNAAQLVVTYTMPPANTAPVLDNSGTMTLTSITEDQTASVGQTVASIISSAGGDRITDIDSGAVEGIAITATTNGNGSWEYSTNGGSTWNSVGTVANNSALLLRSTDMLRFVPNAQNATTGDITFRAWDQSSGTFGTKVDTTTNGTTTAFSTATEVASITVTAVNDAPYMPGVALPSTIEDVNATIAVSYLAGFSSDVDTGALKGLAIVGIDNTNGTWQYTLNGTNWFNIGSVSDSNTLLLASDATSAFRFVPNANWNGVTGLFSYKAWDQTSGTAGTYVDASVSGGTTAFSGTSGSSLSVNPVNDVPVRTAGSPAAINVNEDSANVTAVSLGMGGLTYSPGGGSDEAGQTLTYTVTAIPAHITLWKADGVTQVTASTVVTLTELQGLKYKTVANANGSGNLTWTVVDNGGTSNGGVNTLTETLSVTVGAVNDAPVRTAGTVASLTVSEDSGFTSLGLGSVAYGPGGSADESGQTLTYSVTALPSGSIGNVYLADGTTLVTTSSYTLAQIQGMQFKTTLNGNGVTAFQYNVTDSGGTANGGLDSISEFILITVTAVNDAPVVTTTGSALSYTENAAATAIDTGVTVSDIDNTNLTGATIAISTNYANGEDTLAFTNQLGITGSWNSTTGVLTLSGTTTVANYQTALRAVTYVNTSDNPSTLTRTVSFVATDGTTPSTAATRQITVTAVNDAPTAVITPVSYAATEQVALTLKNTGLSISDVDAGAGSMTVTLSVTEGTLTVTAGGSGAVVTNSGTSSVTITGTLTQINNLLSTDATSTVSYIDNIDAPSASATLTLQVNDNGNTGGGSLTNSDTATINITAVNDAPTLSTMAAPVTTVNEDTQATVTFANLQTQGNEADVDGTVTAFVVKAVSSGTLLVGTSPGTATTWAAGTNDTIDATRQGYWTGAQDANGTLNAFTLVAKDNGALESATPVQVQVAVTAVNDAPIRTAGTVSNLTVLEDSGFTSLGFGGVAYGPGGGADESGQTLTCQITILPNATTFGKVYLADGTTQVTLNSFYTLAEIRGLQFQPTADKTGTTGFAFNVADSGGTANGGLDYIQEFILITITPVNDAPVITTTAAPLAYTENDPATAIDPGLTVSDVDNTNLTGATVTISANYVNGQDVLGFTNQLGITGSWSAATGVLTLSGTTTKANYQTALRSVTYLNNSENPSTLTRTISFVAGDGTANSTAATRDISITPVNDAPTATITPVSYAATEQVALTLKNTGLSISDVDAGSGSMTVTLSVTEGTLTVTAGGSGAVVTNSGTSSVTITGTLTQINNLLSTDATSTVSYIDNIDAPSASATLTLQVNDNGNTGGGSLTNSDTATINITAVNDAPVATITPATYAATEQVALTLKNTGLSISDVDAASGSMTVTLSVTEGTLTVTAGGSGAVVTNSGTSSVTITGTVTQVNNLLSTDATSTVSYIDNTDTPSASATLTLQVNDNGNTGGGSLTNSDAATINITAVNDAPTATITPATYAATEQVALTLHGTGLSIADVDAGAAAVRATLSVTSGILTAAAGTTGVTVTGSGTASVTLDGTLTQINNLLAGSLSGTLTYTANSDAPAASATLALTASDLGNTGTGGTLTGSDTATINITAVNDAPVLDNSGTMTLTTITEDNTTNTGDAVGSIILSAGGDRITDVDSAFAFEGFAVTGLASGNGTWEYTINGTNWLAVGSVSDSSALLLRDTDRLRLVPNGQNATSATVTFRAWDQTSGTQGTKVDVGTNGGTTPYSTATETASITVTAVNDAPTATNLNAAEAYTEDTALNLTDIVVSDVDSASVTVTLTLSNTAAGSLNTGTSGAVTSTYVAGTGVWTASGAIADVNALLAALTFTPTANFNSNFTIATSVSDGVAAAVTGTKSMTGTAVNDAPTATNLSAAETYTEDTALNLSDIVVSDVDNASVTVTLTLSNTAAGSLNTGTSGAVTSTYVAGTGVWTASGAITDVNTLLAGLTFTPAANFNSSFTIATSVSDGSLNVTGTKSITGTAVNDAPTFNSGTGFLSSDPGVNDVARSTLVQADGKIVIAGRSFNGTDYDFGIVRYNADGSLDNTFGTGGTVTVGIGTDDYGTTVAMQADGKYVVAGYSYGGLFSQFSVVRLNADGSLDTTFDVDGKLATTVGTGNAQVNSVSVQNDGTILVAGMSYAGANLNFAAVRYNTDGSLDTSFDSDGIVVTAVGTQHDYVYNMLVQNDGKIVLTGYALNAGNYDYAAVRYNIDGSLDSSFDGDGRVMVNFGGTNEDYSFASALQADGKILLAGSTQGAGDRDFAIVRLNTDGSLDTTFDTDGWQTVNFGMTTNIVRGLAVQADGKIVAAGYRFDGTVYDFAVARFNTNGSLDTSFDGDGKLTLDYSVTDYATSVAIQPNGRIVMSGVIHNGSEDDFGVVRLNSNGSLDSRFNLSNTLDGNPTFVENGSAVILDANVVVFDEELSAANNFNNATLTLVRNGAANSEDLYSNTGLLDILNQAGSLSYNGTTIGTVTSNSGGTLVLTFNSNATQSFVNATLQAIAYSNSSDAPPSSVQIDWTFNDGNTGSQGSGGALAATGSTTVNITAVNDAPTITNAASVVLTGTNEKTSSGGTLASAILTASSSADVDTGAVSGLAITSKTGNGTWQYSTDGTTWRNFGSVSSTNALLITSTSQVRYIPDSANGETATFTYKAWDQMSGTASDNATARFGSTASSGGTTAFSANTGTAQMVVTSVNDAPLLDNSGTMTLPTITKSQTNNGGNDVASVIASAGGDRITDIDTGAVEGIAITGFASGNGTWQYSTDGGTVWTNVGTVSGSSALLLRDTDLVRFVPNGVSPTAAGFDFRAWDQSTGSFGTKVDVSTNGVTTAFSAATETANITVIDVNTAPVLDSSKTPVLTTINEDPGAPSGAVGSLVSQLIDFATPSGQVDNVTDVDSGAGLGIAITAADTTNGAWFYSINNGSTWNALGTVSSSNARLLSADIDTRLYFQANANYHGTLANAITFRAWDQSSGSNGGTASMLATQTVLDQFSAASYSNNDGALNWSGAWIESDAGGTGPTAGDIDITSGYVRFKPVSVGNSFAREVNLLSASAATFSFSMPFNSLGAAQVLVQVSNNGGSSYTTLETITSATSPGTKTYDISSYVAPNTRIRFYAASTNASGMRIDDVQIQYSSSGGSSAFSTASDTASLVVNPVADTPSITSATTNEDTQSASGLVITRNAFDGTEVTHYKITGITSGTLYKNDGVTQITNGSFITFAEGNAGLKFTPTADFNGTGNFTLQASTSNSDAGLGGNSVLASVTVNPVNDAPLLADTILGLTMAEDAGTPSGTVGSLIGNFTGGITDVDSGAVKGIAIVASNETNGIWYYSTNGGTNWTAVGTVSSASSLLLADNASTRLYFAPGSNYNGTSISALTVRGWDQTAGTAGNRVDTSSNGTTTAFSGATDVIDAVVSAVNDEQVLTTFSGLTVSENSAGNVISNAVLLTTDVDNTTSQLVYTVTSATTNGTLRRGGVALAVNSTFTQADVNSGVVTYDHNGSETSADGFSFDVGDGAGTNSSGTFNFTVTPVNDNPPVITSNGAGATASINVAENATAVTTVTATDGDLPAQTLTYTIIGGADSALFIINSSTGVLTFVSGRDREAHTDANVDGIYDVTVQSSDGILTDTQAISVTITDVDEFDVGAVADSNAAANTVAENASNGTVVGITASAGDADATTNAITYSLFDDAGGRFAINSSTGVVTVADGTLLNREAAASHDITVRATSADGSSADTVFTINLNDLDEFDTGAVTDSNATANYVLENASNGTTVGITGIATDPDGTDVVTYSLDSDASGRFTINSTTGVVTVTGAIDREAAASYNITVRATSTDTSFSTQTFTVNIGDVNEFATSPVTDSNATANSVVENAANGTVVNITGLASDADATTNTITYSLFDNDGGRFAINSSSGVVTVAGAINREADGPTRNITIRATSADGSTSDQTFSIAIVDADEFAVTAPTDSDATASAVNENVAIGTAVGITASSSDADATTNSVTYSLFNNDGGNFAIDANTGVVTTTAALNRETLGASRNITVRATSADGSTADTLFTININDLDEFDTGSVTDSNATANTISENSANGTLVNITGLASDTDATTNAITYSLDDNAGGRFTINSSTGVVTVLDGSLLNYEAATSHNITIRATSADTSFSTQSFTINLTDVNEGAVSAVSDSNAAANTVLENSTNGTTIGITGLATDPDGTDTVVYSLDDNAGGRFTIDTNTGVVTVAGAIDREAAASYNITVRATSTDTSFSTQIFTINIGDVNEFATSAVTDSSATANSVVENSANGTVVNITGLASDADATTNAITYSLDDSASGRFAIDAITGVVTVADGSGLNYEAAASHNITIRATSADTSFSTQSFTINLTDVNEAAVGAVSDSNIAANDVLENASNGTTVGITGLANDPDGTDVVTYSLDSDASGRFTINSTTGVVTVNGAIDREAAASYDITIRATSSDTSFSTQSFTINIGDVNEFATTSVTDSVPSVNSVVENAGIGTTVGLTAFASDGDATTNTITYSLFDNAGGRFAINSSTGVVTVAGTINREVDGASRNITVRATSTDGSSSDQTFSIAIIDADEFDVTAPTDANAAANAVNENEAIGTVVGITANAGDSDATTNTVTYSLFDNDGGNFAIDANTGIVTTAAALNRETLGAFRNITVRATSVDGSTADTVFTININDLDEFDVGAVTDSNATANIIAENSANGTVVNITGLATDADATTNAITYSLDDNAGGRFTINISTGVVTVSNSSMLDYEASTSHNITIRATSADTSFSTQSFTINLTDVNEGAVGAVSDNNAAANFVNENAANGTAVGITGLATDPDGTDTVTYSLDDNAGGRFTINTTTGVVTVNGAIDREAAASYNITIRATSSDTSSSMQTFTINIGDVNEFATSAVTDANATANSVVENAANGTVVNITGLATDADATTNAITYSLFDNDGGRFAIHASTGVVTVAGTINREVDGASRNITVRATSADGSFSDQTFSIAIVDADEFDVTAPADTDATANAVNENEAIGTVVGITANAGDSDATTNTVTYSLFDNDGGNFAIDAGTGVVTTAAALNRESLGASRSITIRATSVDGSTADTVFTININDLDEFDVGAVTDSNATANIIAENSANGTVVNITGLATDADATTNAITYSLDDNAGGRFTINSSTGVVTVANSSLLDYEASTSHNITIRATSSDTSFSTQTFTINIGDVNEFATSSVTDSVPSVNSVVENASIGTTVGLTAFASDDDATTNTITYSLFDNDGGRFAIHASTGVVTVAGTINREVDGASRNITVRATSADGSFSDQTFSIAIVDADEFDVTAPTDTDATANAVNENVTIGTLAGITGNAGDSDATTNTVTYSLFDNDGGNFAIDASTGVVTTAAALNRESLGASRSITIRATSADGSTADTVFTININDLDEFDVGAVTDSNATANIIAENSANGTVVNITGLATDADATTNAITYSLDDNAGGRFTINASTGVVTVNGAIDREAAASYNITIRATSTDTSSSTQTFTINIGDVNEFAVGSVTDSNAAANSVAENATIGTAVGITAVASDADATTNAITYTLDNNAGGRFAIHSVTGVVTVAGALDYETATSHNITVRATSADGSFSTRLFTTNVADVNDNTPVVAPNQQFSISELATVGTVPGDVVATDADTTGTLQGWTITGGNTDGVFAINPATGRITVADATRLDFETTSSYSLTVTVFDGVTVSAPQSISILVLDQNEAPAFAVYPTLSINENTANGTVVGTATATDQDTGDSLTSSIVSSSLPSAFAIDAVSGQIRVINSTALNYEAVASVTLNLRVTDAAGLTDTQIITILINDVNDAPVATSDSYTALQIQTLNAVSGVLVNDHDEDGQHLTAILVSGPIHGSLVFNADGTFQYLSSDVFTGLDSFHYRVTDGTLSSNVVTVTIDVLQSISSGIGSGSGSGGSGNSSGSTTTTNSSGSSTSNTLPGNAPAAISPVAAATGLNLQDPGLRSLNQGPQDSESEIGTTPIGRGLSDSVADALLNLTFFTDEVSVNREAPERSRSGSVSRVLTTLWNGSSFLIDPLDTVASGSVFIYQHVADTDNSDVAADMQGMADIVVVGSTAVVSTSMSVGYAIWMLRGGSLLTAFMSASPAWQSFDPLPILQSFNKDEFDDDETLLKIVSKKAVAPAHSKKRGTNS